MAALLSWFTRFLIVQALLEIVQKAFIFLQFNIIIAFILNYIANNHFDLSLFDLGDAVGTMISGLPPIVQYVMEKFQIVSGIFLVLNAYLARFAYRLVFGSLR